MRRVYVYCPVARKVVPKHEAERAVSPEMVTDLQRPIKSPIDGTMLTSRRDLRRHNRTHGVEQVGNDLKRSSGPPPDPYPGLEHEIGARISEAGIRF